MRTIAAVALALIVVALAVTLMMCRGARKTPSQFGAIPGFISAEIVSSSDFSSLWRVRVAHKGREYFCILKLNVDAGGNAIYPDKDEVFTTILIEGDGYELFDRSGKLGGLPGVFITKLGSKGFFAGKPGEERKPVDIDPGKVNITNFDFDAILQSPEGLMVRIIRESEEIASGRLPLRLSLGGDTATAQIEQMFVSRKVASGLIHVFSGSQTVSPGANSIRPSAQAVGDNVWFHKGSFVGFDDGITLVADEGKVFFERDGREQSFATPGINPSNRAVFTGDSLIWTDVDGLLLKTGVDGKTLRTGIYVSGPVGRSGDFIVSGFDAFSLDLKRDFSHTSFSWSEEGCFLAMDNGYLVSRGRHGWKVKADIPADAVLERLEDGKYFFSYESKVTGLFSIATGDADDPAGLVLKGGGDINFPDGVTVESGVQKGLDGRSFWKREGWGLQRFGGIGIIALNPKGGERELISHDTGLKAVFWDDAKLSVKALTKKHVVFELDGYVISVERLVN